MRPQFIEKRQRLARRQLIRARSSASRSSTGSGCCGRGRRVAARRKIAADRRQSVIGARPAARFFSSSASTSEARADHGGRQVRRASPPGCRRSGRRRRHDLVQEDDVALPFAHLDRRIGEVGEPAGERGQLVIMRGEQGAAAIDLVQMLDRRPGDRQAVEGRVPRPISSRMTKERSVAWLRMAAVSTISTMKVERPRARSSAAPTRLNRRSTTPICARAAGTKEPIWARMHDQRILAQEGRFAGHVGAGQEPDALVAVLRREAAVIGDEGRAAGLGERMLDHRMAAVQRSRTRERRRPCGRTIAAPLGEFGERRQRHRARRWRRQPRRWPAPAPRRPRRAPRRCRARARGRGWPPRRSAPRGCRVRRW